MIEHKRPLTPQQEHFCILYTSRGEFGRNAYKSYAEAYGFDIPLTETGGIDYKSSEYRTCSANASRLLTTPNINSRIKEIYLTKFNDSTEVDARLTEIIESGKDTDSIQAIKIHNDLKQRITKKIDITSAGRPLQSVSDEELKAMLD